MSPTDVYMHAAGNHASLSTKLGRMERELASEIKGSLEESRALREKFQEDLECVQQDAQRRLVERKAKWKEHALCMEQEKADAILQAELLQQQLVDSAREVRLARERMFQLESEAQSIRSSPPQVVERADPGTVVEIMQLREKMAATEEQARRAQRTAAEAREAVGRESAINQGFQRDVDNARHRLLTVQGSLAELSEENAKLRRELENERIKTVAGSRRLADAVQRQDDARSEVRRDSVQLREQRDRLAQDTAVLGIKLHQMKKKHAAGRLLHALSQTRHCSLARALRALIVGVTNDIHMKKQTRQQEEHGSEVASLELDLHGAETRCRDARRRVDLLRDSRETVAVLAVSAYRRRRQGMTLAGAAAEEGRPGGDAPSLVLRWCFWGWARVAHGGCAAVAKRATRAEAEKELPGVREQLLVAVERARGAMAERDRHRATSEDLAEQIKHFTADLENARTALSATKSMASSARDRCIHLGAARLHKTLERTRCDRLARAFAVWVDPGREFPSPPRTQHNNAFFSPHKDDTTTSGTFPGETQGPSQQQQGDAQPRPQAPEARSSEAARTDNPRGGAPTADSIFVSYSSAPVSGAGSKQGATRKSDVGRKREYFVSSQGNEGDGATPSVVESNGEATPNRRDAVTDSDAMANNERTSPLVSTLIDSIPAAVSYKPSNNQDCSRDCVSGSFPFPVTTFTTAPTAALRAIASQPAAFRTKANAHSCNKNSGGSIPVPACNGRSSGCGWSADPDLPRVVLSSRAAVGQELYAVGESLLRCVEADHREIHGRPYRPIPITPAEREQFRVCLEDAARGPLRRAVLTFLRVQESYRAVATERDRDSVDSSRQGRRGGHSRGLESRVKGWASDGGGGGFCGPRCKSTRDAEERQYEVFSLTTGPLSSPAEKARAARVLRDRLVPILEDADEAWGRQRRPWQKMPPSGGGRATAASGFSRGQRRKTAATKERNIPRCLHRGWERKMPSRESRRVCLLDSGAGPRKFWETVAGPRFVEASWNLDVKALEQQLWDLAMLVRGQDEENRGKAGHRHGLALNRCERLRRTLDARIFELLLLHVRTRLIWDGFCDDNDDEGQNGDGDDFNNSSTRLDIDGGIHSQDLAILSTSGRGWLAG